MNWIDTIKSSGRFAFNSRNDTIDKASSWNFKACSSGLTTTGTGLFSASTGKHWTYIVIQE